MKTAKYIYKKPVLELPETQDLASVTVDSDFTIIHANSQFCELIGYSNLELYTLDLEGIMLLIHPEERQDILDWLEMADYDPLLIMREPQRLIKKDGTIIPTMKTVRNSSCDESGRRIVAVATFEVL